MHNATLDSRLLYSKWFFFFFFFLKRHKNNETPDKERKKKRKIIREKEERENEMKRKLRGRKRRWRNYIVFNIFVTCLISFNNGIKLHYEVRRNRVKQREEIISSMDTCTHTLDVHHHHGWCRYAFGIYYVQCARAMCSSAQWNDGRPPIFTRFTCVRHIEPHITTSRPYTVHNQISVAQRNQWTAGHRGVISDYIHCSINCNTQTFEFSLSRHFLRAKSRGFS